MDTGLKRFARLVTPGIARNIAVLNEHLFGAPILGFPSQPIAALEQQDAFAGRSQVAGQGAATGPGTDDDNVIVSVAHAIFSQ